MLPVLVQPCFLSHTYKCWHSPPLSAYIINTVGPHFESECSQWSEPWLSCDDWGSGRPIHKQFTMETTVVILEGISYLVTYPAHVALVGGSQFSVTEGSCVFIAALRFWTASGVRAVACEYQKRVLEYTNLTTKFGLWMWPILRNWCKPFHPCTELRCKHLEQQGLTTKGVT